MFATPRELVRLLTEAGPQLIPEARGFIMDALVGRGSVAVAPVAEAFLTTPRGPVGDRLGEVLVDIYRQEPALRHEIADTLIQAVDQALAAGGSRAAGPLLGWLTECAIQGPIAAARPLALRVLEVAAAESDPYTVAIGAAHELAKAPQP